MRRAFGATLTFLLVTRDCSLATVRNNRSRNGRIVSRIFVVLLVLACGGAVISRVAADETRTTKIKKALLVGIDGTRYDALREADAPQLDRLIETGILDNQCLILGPRYQKNDTVSGPGWSSILTGVWADRHGVHDNTFQGQKLDEQPHFFARLKAHDARARTVSLVTWKPIEKWIVRDADVHRAFDDESKEYEKFDAAASQAAIAELADPALTCMFLYFGQVDETGHKHGFHPTVAPYRQAIERVDAHLGEVLAALRARPSYDTEDWLIVVTSDHGGRGTDHARGWQVPEILHSFLIVSGNAAERGTFAEPTYIVDAPVTVLAHLGVPIDERWRLDGRPVGLKH